MNASVVMWAVMLSVLLFWVLVASFFGGVVLGMRVGSGGTRSLFGVIRGSSVQAADPEYGHPDTEDSLKDSLKKAFGGGSLTTGPMATQYRYIFDGNGASADAGTTPSDSTKFTNMVETLISIDQ